jgi:hypothetical protein
VFEYNVNQTFSTPPQKGGFLFTYFYIMPNSVSDYVPTADDLRIRSLLEESAQRAATPTPQV